MRSYYLDCQFDKAYKIGESFDIKKWECKKYLFRKLVLVCKDKILNTTETTSVVNTCINKHIHTKDDCLIDNVSLVSICSFLVILLLFITTFVIESTI